MTTALHIACLPFPTFQGTQAALGAMLRASQKAGIDTHLLAYGNGSHRNQETYRVHRLCGVIKTSLRSGPSLQKLAIDATVPRAAQKLVDELQPDRIIAHHVEAAVALSSGTVESFDFVAHTSLETELASYFPAVARPACETVGRWVDRLATSRASRLYAVSPALTTRIATMSGREVTYLPAPWSNDPPIAARANTRSRARATLDLPDVPTLLYAGNLDRYQGWELVLDIVDALFAMGGTVHTVFATESDPTPLRKAAQRRGIAEQISIRRLDGEPQRHALHAAANIAVIPRRAEGGVPIKLLDALSRGVPVVATRRSTGGLSLNGACWVVADDAPNEAAAAVHALLDDPKTAARFAQRGPSYISENHSDMAFVRTLHTEMTGIPGTTPSPVSETHKANRRGDLHSSERRGAN